MKMSKITFEYFDFRYCSDDLPDDERRKNIEYRAIKFDDKNYIIYSLTSNKLELNIRSCRAVEQALNNGYWIPIDRKKDEEFRKRWIENIKKMNI